MVKSNPKQHNKSCESISIFALILVAIIILSIVLSKLIISIGKFLFLNNIFLDYKLCILWLLITLVLLMLLKNFIENFKCTQIFDFNILNWLFNKTKYYNYTIFFVFSNIKIILLFLIGGCIIFILSTHYTSNLYNWTTLLSGWTAFSGIGIGFLYNRENSKYKHQRESIISLHRIISYLDQMNNLDRNEDIDAFNCWVIENLLNFSMIETYDIQIVIAYLLSKRNSISIKNCNMHHNIKQNFFDNNKDKIKENILSEVCNYFNHNSTQWKCNIDSNFCSFNKQRVIGLTELESLIYPKEKNIYNYKHNAKLCIRDKIYNIVLNKYEKENTYEKQLILAKITEETADFYNKRHYYHIPKDIKRYMKCQRDFDKNNIEILLKKIRYYYHIFG